MKPQLEDDTTGVSSTSETVDNEPASRKLADLHLRYINTFILHEKLLLTYDTYDTIKLICYKHFLQQKALFVEGLTIS